MLACRVPNGQPSRSKNVSRPLLVVNGAGFESAGQIDMGYACESTHDRSNAMASDNAARDAELKSIIDKAGGSRSGWSPVGPAGDVIERDRCVGVRVAAKHKGITLSGSRFVIGRMLGTGSVGLGAAPPDRRGGLGLRD